ncbi:unnamed protein product [Thelazia callipaeda]|uniref:Nucleoporin p58/p45 n=1 Tax=Thelazia callipaeda TaxID=103827 RepID=A0A0N5CN40_THECL|nr:unnamed protein product [Thelazia callipaeda]
MSGFTFGLSGAAVSSAPATSSLFGTVQKPLFGTPTTTQPTANAGLFGTSTSLATTSTTSALFGVSVPSTGFFGSPAKTTGSLLGFAATTTTATGGFFGSLPATSASGLFGSTPSVSTSGSLFGSPAPGFFSTPAVSTTTLSGGLFGASENSAYTVGKGLGGIGTLTTVGSAANGSIGVAGAAASGNPMEAEVSQVVMGLFNLLRNQIKRNHELSEEFAMYSSDSCLEMDEKIKGLGAIRVKRADLMRSAQTKANELLGKIQRDVRAAEQVRRRQRETSKNPQFGRKQALSYLVGICVEHEDIVREFVTTLNLLEERVIAKLNKVNNILCSCFHCDLTSKEDLQKHFEHYDQSFKVICSDIYRCKIQVERYIFGIS